MMALLGPSCLVHMTVQVEMWQKTMKGGANTMTAPFTSTLSAWKPNQGQVNSTPLASQWWIWLAIDVGHDQQAHHV